MTARDIRIMCTYYLIRIERNGGQPQIWKVSNDNLALNQKGFLRESWKEKSMPSKSPFFKNTQRRFERRSKLFSTEPIRIERNGGQPQIWKVSNDNMALNQKGFLRESWKKKSMPSKSPFLKKTPRRFEYRSKLFGTEPIRIERNGGQP